MSDDPTTVPENAGYEVETGTETGIGANRQPSTTKRDKWAERRANIRNTFGQGPGRIAIFTVLLFLAIVAMVGIRSCSHKPVEAKSEASMDVPGAPTTEVSTKAVTPQELKRHAEFSQAEAAKAHAAGKDYQTSFDPVVSADKPASSHASNGSFDIGDGSAPTRPPTAQPDANQAALPKGLVPLGGAAQGVAASGDMEGEGSAAAAPTPEQQKAKQDAEKAHMDAYNKAVANRDKWVGDTRDRVISEAEEILGVGKDGQNQIRYSGYRSFSYATATNDANGTTAAPAGSAAAREAARPSDAKAAASNAEKGPPLIKTGNTLYITTNSMVNTDHGGKLFGTVRGGAWNGSQVICGIEQAPDNIRAHCTTLAPQDSRPTMKIDGVLLRESDMAQGIAESVNHHTISRYTALAVSSLLQGYGEAYSYQQGTAVVTPNGTVLQTNQAPSDKQVIGRALGQIGTNAGSEIMKGFNRPPTYSTPADQGMILYFLSDVFAPSSAQ